MLRGDSAFPVRSFSSLITDVLGEGKSYFANKLPVKEINYLAQTIKLHHSGTFQHSLNVARLSSWLARQVGFSHQEILTISLGALLHDFGKTKIAPEILDKPGRLTYCEWDLIKKHPQDGVSMLSVYPWAECLLPIVANHHERVDGAGYSCLPGEKIPVSAKIVSISDAFDAMITPRPYRSGWLLDRSWRELEENSGTQFDPDLVSLFILVTSKLIKP